MAITITSGPEEATQVVVRELTALNRARGTSDAGESGGGKAQAVKASLPIYHMGPDALTTGVTQPAASARRIGWRYLLAKGQTKCAVEVIGDAVSSITEGNVARNLEQALSVASKTVDKFKRYEARVLVFGRAGNSLLWLHADADAGGDRYFSLDEQPREVDEEGAMLSASRKAQMRQVMKTFRQSTGMAVDDADESGG
jgi:hypothetical protein